MQKIGIYMRVSTVGQAQEGDSLAAQRDALIAYINAHPDMVLAGEYQDDGISGQKWAQRDELQRLLADVESGKLDMILCTKMDRLHRSLKNFLTMQEILDKHGVTWLAILEPMYDTSTPAGQLIINQMMSFAQFEAQNTGARIRQVMDYKISQGQVVTGSTPAGYRIVDKRLVPDENALSVQEAFRIYSECSNLTRTMDLCRNLPGLPRFSCKFRKMLMNRKYIGECRGNASYCPPIIDRNLFEDVQRKLSMNIKASQKRTYIFSGLLKCSACGRSLVISTNLQHRKDGDVRYHYYRCPLHYQPPRTCPNTLAIRETVLEEYLLSHLKEAIKGYVFECKQAAAPIKDNQKRIADLRRKIDRLKDLYVNELIGLDEYKTDKERYLAEIESLTASGPEPQPVDTSRLESLLTTDIASYYQGLDLEEKRYFWRSIIKEVVMSPDKEYTIHFL